MEDEKEKEEAAQLEFSAFPFKPYGIQTRFMTAVYRALQQGGVAIVESPTGTMISATFAFIALSLRSLWTCIFPFLQVRMGFLVAAFFSALLMEFALPSFGFCC
jgi:hypothetical protein